MESDPAKRRRDLQSKLFLVTKKADGFKREIETELNGSLRRIIEDKWSQALDDKILIEAELEILM